MRPHGSIEAVGAFRLWSVFSMLQKKSATGAHASVTVVYETISKIYLLSFFLICFQTVVEELQVARDVLFIDEATRKRLAIVVNRDVERLCKVAKLGLL